MLIQKTFVTGCATCGVTAQKRDDIYEQIIPNISIKEFLTLLKVKD